MKATKVVLTILVLTLVSCRRSETPLTGGYGSNVLSGQVVMATGGSPAGVEVSVSGTGMTMTVGGEGRFAFMGVPEGAELQFRRADDGIDARMRVERSSAPVVVEVSASGARGRRRGAGRSLEYEGIIKEKGENDQGDNVLTVFTSHKTEVEVVVNDDTVIRKGNRTFTFDELETGWRVHVKALDVDGVLTAREVKVQQMGEDDEDEGEATMNANGLVVAKDGTTLTVSTSAHGDVTVQTNDSTIIKQQGVQISVDAIEVGWEINAHGTRVDNTTLLARKIEVRGNSKKPKK